MSKRRALRALFRARNHWRTPLQSCEASELRAWFRTRGIYAALSVAEYASTRRGPAVDYRILYRALMTLDATSPAHGTRIAAWARRTLAFAHARCPADWRATRNLMLLLLARFRCTPAIARCLAQLTQRGDAAAELLVELDKQELN